MRRLTHPIGALTLVAAVALTGCRFDIRGILPPADAGEPADAPRDGAADAMSDARDVGADGLPADALDAGEAEGGPDAGGQDATQQDAAQQDATQQDAAVVPFCDRNNPSLVACYRFEGNAEDGSAYGNSGVAAAVTYQTGVSGQAVHTVSGSDIAVLERASLDCTSAITIEVWVRPDSLPSTGRAGIVDNDGQYGLFIHPGGEARCSAGGSWVVAAGAAVVGEWHHLACVYDGAAISLYRDGTPVASLGQTGGIPTGGTTGLRIGLNNPTGDPFSGLIDGLRIWCVARAAADLCTVAASCG